MSKPITLRLPASIVMKAEEDLDVMRLRIEAASEGPVGFLEAIIRAAERGS